ncbi:enoyl-CoA hydratase/isomerase family protein [Sphingobacterium hotanense]|uniref:enoyl-CoA hydratase/isomerase family protein n=1 Tax=Sphingobacterium hotanense TaxID=649196 RepID=UPI0021A5656B|nr:enoyl-CoA hydratase-related protein [Sphingobacterium hotanense]MCT1523594.1 enoyl-CoA hydratase-related protein [Sphingobacterium hotanense]
MSYQNLLLSHKGYTAYVTINREAKLNALNYETIAELKGVFHELQQDDNTRGVILTGSGQKAFVAGADIQEFMEKSNEQAMELSAFGHELMDSLSTFPKPVIAAINGYALGGGLELALACHMRLASDNVKMGLPEVSLGLIPGYGGTQRLTQLVGKGKALEMILTGDMIDAKEAYQWGLVNKVVPQDALLSAAEAILEKTFLRSKSAIATAIHVVNAGFEKTIDGYQLEIENFGKSFGSEDFKEGVTAFLEKRKPNF